MRRVLWRNEVFGDEMPGHNKVSQCVSQINFSNVQGNKRKNHKTSTCRKMFQIQPNSHHNETEMVYLKNF